MTSKDAHKLEMETQLKAFNAWIDLQDGRDQHAGPVVTAQKDVAMQPMYGTPDTMNDLNMDSVQSWSQVRESADSIWDSLKSGFSDTRVKIK